VLQKSSVWGALQSCLAGLQCNRMTRFICRMKQNQRAQHSVVHLRLMKKRIATLGGMHKKRCNARKEEQNNEHRLNIIHSRQEAQDWRRKGVQAHSLYWKMKRMRTYKRRHCTGRLSTWERKSAGIVMEDEAHENVQAQALYWKNKHMRTYKRRHCNGRWSAWGCTSTGIVMKDEAHENVQAQAL